MPLRPTTPSLGHSLFTKEQGEKPHTVPALPYEIEKKLLLRASTGAFLFLFRPLLFSKFCNMSSLTGRRPKDNVRMKSPSGYR